MQPSTDDVHVVAIPGSLRDQSRTRAAAREALDAAAEAGAETTLVDLREYDLPMVDGDARDAGDADRLERVVGDADALLLATPLYHGSMAAPLKNALDYCSGTEFEDTTAGLVEVAGGSYPGPALQHLRQVCRTLRMWTHPLEVGVPDSSSTIADGEVRDEHVRDRLRRLGRELVRYAGVADYPQTQRAAELVADD